MREFIEEHKEYLVPAVAGLAAVVSTVAAYYLGKSSGRKEAVSALDEDWDSLKTGIEKTLEEEGLK